MKQVDIKITKTARYFQLGEITPATTDVLIACHGYAQLANYFLKWFEPFDLKNTVIIAPEGLSRFYWNGFSGNVVASWMTKVDRQNDIDDYVLYLDQVIDSLSLPSNIKLSALGFSQGGATVSRWIANSRYKFNNLVLWAAVFPDDIEVLSLKNLIPNPIQILFGNNDQFYNVEQIELLKKRLQKTEISIEFTDFIGAHKIYKEPLNNLYQKIHLS